ncbi:hypothetical protein L6164_028076 [Bauhinia variegata]|uniref:Uncharacterized protein n=1 Tax=Bauhinia variegata TaxID=167791 RepID=A0ACB9LVD0_BAUVA|nr:hypothetical protein L6164_028076 [Bauhinia variegata]
MGEFIVVEKHGQAEAGTYRDDGNSQAWQDAQPQHRHSKSASDRNFKISSEAVSHFTETDQNEALVSPPSIEASRLQNPLHDNLTYINKNTLNHRATLEKDVEQLQLRLQQERSMRLLLERAMAEPQVHYLLDTGTLLLRQKT